MRIRLVCQETLCKYLETPDLTPADLTVFGFNGVGEVSYERELRGETRFFEELATLTKKEGCVAVCGCITDSLSHKRRSAVVAENGRILGVSDMLHAIDGELGSGAFLRVYDTKIGKVGLAVADDLRFPEVIKALSVCGSDIIVCPQTRVACIHTALLRSHAYCFGVPCILCADGYAAIANPDGALAFATPQSPQTVEISVRKEYHLIETRLRFVKETQ